MDRKQPSYPVASTADSAVVQTCSRDAENPAICVVGGFGVEDQDSVRKTRRQ